jgi:hypothetical protein
MSQWPAYNAMHANMRAEHTGCTRKEKVYAPAVVALVKHSVQQLNKL